MDTDEDAPGNEIGASILLPNPHDIERNSEKFVTYD